MRWNCPHCRIDLETSDDQITANWSFSLCPKCSRFGLIRATATSAIKVDRAPAGENFIRASNSDFPTIRTAQLRSRTAEIPKPEPIKTETSFKFEPTIKLPEPLPEVPEKVKAVLPRLVLFACAGMLAWNGYRFLQISNVPDVEVNDRVIAKAMAPVHIEAGDMVRARGNGMQIRNGPGYQFPVVGELKPNNPFKVVLVEEPWFQVRTGTDSPTWVMSDEITPAN